VFAVEVGCRGFVAKSTVNVLKSLGGVGRRLRSIIKELACTAERYSAWIWNSCMSDGHTG